MNRLPDPRRGQDILTDQVRLRHELRQLLVDDVGGGLVRTSLPGGTTISMRRTGESETTGIFGDRITIRNIDTRTLPAWSVAEIVHMYETDTSKAIANVKRPSSFGIWESIIWVSEAISPGGQGIGYHRGLICTTVVSAVTPSWEYDEAPPSIRGRYNWVEPGYHCTPIPGEHVLALEGGFDGWPTAADYWIQWRVGNAFVIVAVLDHVSIYAAHRLTTSIRKLTDWPVAKVCAVSPSGGFL